MKLYQSCKSLIKDHTLEIYNCTLLIPLDMPLEILYQDDFLVAVNKPYGYLTHKSKLDPYAQEIVLQTLRDQIQRFVYPIHRLDRKTTGVLLFGLDPNTHKNMSKLFQENKVRKIYYAVTRGYLLGEGLIDKPLINEAGNSQEAHTEYQNIACTELPWPLGKHETSRYSLIKLMPKTGRMHQLRRHLSHIFHPIIGDRPHGCSKQNRLFKQKWNYTEMLLHAKKLSFPHPENGQMVIIEADFHPNYIEMLKLLNLPVPD